MPHIKHLSSIVVGALLSCSLSACTRTDRATVPTLEEYCLHAGTLMGAAFTPEEVSRCTEEMQPDIEACGRHRDAYLHCAVTAEDNDALLACAELCP